LGRHQAQMVLCGRRLSGGGNQIMWLIIQVTITGATRQPLAWFSSCQLLLTMPFVMMPPPTRMGAPLIFPGIIASKSKHGPGVEV
jgi:hypothetical protein